MKERRMGWVGHVARKGCRTRVYGVLLEDLKENDNLKDLGLKLDDD